MTSAVSASTHAQSGTLSRAGLRRVVIVLSVTEITSWGVLYYAFPVLATTIVADTGWSTPAVAGAFSASQVVSALLGIIVGRVIDRYGPRVIMTGGSLLSVPALATIVLAPSYGVFLAGWVLVGAAMAGVLYPPAFAALTHWGGTSRVSALTTLTLVAGLASTVFAPLTAVLNHHLDWRDTYLVLLVVLALVTVPTHWIGLRQPWITAHQAGRHGPSAPIRRVWTTRPFILLAACTSAVAFCIYAVVINLVPLLVQRGLTNGQAAVALGLGGIGQVAGRLGYAGFAARVGTIPRTVIVFAGVAVSTALLAALPGPILVLFAVSILGGVSRGIFTLIQATAVSDRWGVLGFGGLNGILTAPLLIASAVAPFAGAVVAEATGSHARAFLILAVIAAAAAAAALGTNPTRKVTTIHEHPA